VAGVGAAVVDVGLAVGTHVARNTRAPVPSRTIISTGGSILAGGATLAGEKIWCVCVCVRENVYMGGSIAPNCFPICILVGR